MKWGGESNKGKEESHQKCTFMLSRKMGPNVFVELCLQCIDCDHDLLSDLWPGQPGLWKSGPHVLATLSTNKPTLHKEVLAASLWSS